MAEIKLGQEVRDKVTGFKGIAVGKTEYLQGCNRISVQPKVNKEGGLVECESFDEPDLEVIGNGILPKPEPKPKPPPCGPRKVASRMSEPIRRY